MRKSWWKKALSVGMILAAAVGLCACGNKADKNQNSALAKEHVYKFEEFELPDFGGDDYSVYRMVCRDGTVYMIVNVYHWTEKGSETDLRLVTMSADGSDINMVSLELPKQEKTDGQGDQAGSEGGSVGVPVPLARAAGEAVPNVQPADPVEPEEDEDTSGEEGEEGEENGGEDTEDPVDYPSRLNVWEYTGYGNFAFDSEGNVYGTKNYNYEDYNDPDNYISIQKNYLCWWNADGSFVREMELEDLNSEEEYLYFSAMSVSEDGTVNIILAGDNVCKIVVDPEGNSSGKTPLPEDVAAIFRNNNAEIIREDGSFLITYYSEEDYTKQYIVSYDPKTDALGEPSELPSSMSWRGYDTMGAGVTSDIVYSNNSGVYAYTVGSQDSAEKMNFVNSDLNIAYFNALVEVDDSTFIGIFYEDYASDGMKAGRFTYVDPKDISDKSVLVFGGIYIEGEIKQRVVEYNRSSDKYRIVLRDYSSYASYDDYQAPYTQLNNDIIAGNMPDILLTSGLPVENYISKGLLADIGKLIEEDEELSQVEFVQNVFDAYSVKDKLYYIIPSFRVNTMIGKVSVLGDRNSWTMADMEELASTLPEGTQMFGEMTRDSFFYQMMAFCGSDFVDVSSGKCNFDTQNFIDMMEYAKKLPESLDEEYFGEDYWMNYESQYRDNRTILNSFYLSRFSNANYSINGRFGEDVAYIGFPTESGMGSYVSANEPFAIAAGSAYKDAAWEFLRYYLTEEYQSELGWGLPVRMDLFKESAQEATKRPYWTDENGEKVEYDETYYINGEEIPLDPMSQEQVDKLVNFVLSVNRREYYDENITNIVNEEMAGFFSGQKSAQETARIIQNRAQVYMNEK